MKNVILALGLLVFSAVFAAAQATDDYKKGEFYVGYSNGQVDTGIDTGNSVDSFFRDRESFHGVNVSGVYNLNRYFGVKGDFSGTFNNKTFTTPNLVGDTTQTVTFDTKRALYNYVGGVQVKDNSNSGTFKPFGHAMIGGATGRSKITNVQCSSPATPCEFASFAGDTVSDTGFSGVFGGGLDFRLNNHFQIRAIQVDYNPVRSFGQWDHNLRLGAGIVF